MSHTGNGEQMLFGPTKYICRDRQIVGQSVKADGTLGPGALEPAQYSKGLLLGAARFHVATRSKLPSLLPPPASSDAREADARRLRRLRGIHDCSKESVEVDCFKESAGEEASS